MEEWTLRQKWAVCQESNRQAKAAKGEDVHEARLPEASTSRVDSELGGRNLMCGRGLGMERYDCWFQQEGEVPGDPLTVSRDVAKARIETMIYEQASKGRMASGIQVVIDGKPTTYRVQKGDAAAMRDLFDICWKAECAKYQKLVQAKAEAKAEAKGAKGETNADQHE